MTGPLLRGNPRGRPFRGSRLLTCGDLRSADSATAQRFGDVQQVTRFWLRGLAQRHTPQDRALAALAGSEGTAASSAICPVRRSRQRLHRRAHYDAGRQPVNPARAFRRRPPVNFRAAEGRAFRGSVTIGGGQFGGQLTRQPCVGDTCMSAADVATGRCRRCPRLPRPWAPRPSATRDASG